MQPYSQKEMYSSTAVKVFPNQKGLQILNSNHFQGAVTYTFSHDYLQTEKGYSELEDIFTTGIEQNTDELTKKHPYNGQFARIGALRYNPTTQDCSVDFKDCGE